MDLIAEDGTAGAATERAPAGVGDNGVWAAGEAVAVTGTDGAV